MSYRATAPFPAGIRGTTLHFEEGQVLDDSLGVELESIGLPVEPIDDNAPGDVETAVERTSGPVKKAPAKKAAAKPTA
jgi:hypothetical protein